MNHGLMEKLVSLIFPAVNERVGASQAGLRAKLDKMRRQIVSNELLPGTLVMIKDPLYLLNPTLKPTTEPTFIGPYTVVKRTMHGPYLLRDDTGVVYKRQVPIDQIKVLYKVPDHDIEQPDDGYEIDYIFGHEEREGGMHYHIKWKGYDKRESTWEPEDHINDVACIERYFRLVMAKETSKQTKTKTTPRNAASAPIMMRMTM